MRSDSSSISVSSIAAFFLLLVTLGSSLFPGFAFAETGEGEEALPIAEVTAMVGKVYLFRSGEKVVATKGMKLFPSDQLVTSEHSAAKVVFVDGSNFMLTQDSSVDIESFWAEAHGTKTTINSVFTLVRGKVRFFFKPREGGVDAVVKTTNAVIGVRGTAFFLENTPNKNTALVVVKGVVAIYNNKEPEKVQMVKENETLTVEREEPPAAPVPAAAKVVEALSKEVEIIPDKVPDGVPPENMALPPPVVPSLKSDGKNSPLVVQKGTIIKQIISPQYVVVPLGAVMVSRAGVACDGKSMERLRLAAQMLDPEAVILATELVQCPTFISESLFWLGFYHRARGEMERAVAASKLVKAESIPLDQKSERENFLEKILLGNFGEIASEWKKKEGKYDKDVEMLLALARTQARLGFFTASLQNYNKAVNLNIKPLSETIAIEVAYLYLLDGKYEKAESEFVKLLDKNLTAQNRMSVDYGLEYVHKSQITIEKSQDNNLSIALNNYGTSDDSHFSIIGLTWESNLVNLSFGSGDMSGRNLPPSVALSTNGNLGSNGVEGSVPQSQLEWKDKFREVNVGKDFSLSSGMNLSGGFSYFEIGNVGKLGYRFAGNYSFPWNLRVDASLERRSALKAKFMMQEHRMFMENKFVATAGYAPYLPGKPMLGVKFAEEGISPLLNSHTGVETLGRLLVHKWGNLEDFIFLNSTLYFSSNTHSLENYYTPKWEVEFAPGFEISKRFFSWLSTELNAAYGFVRKNKSASLISSSQATTATTSPKLYDSKRRETYSSENSIRINPKVHLNLFERFSLAFMGNFLNYKNTGGDQSWSDNRILLKLEWDYNK